MGKFEHEINLWLLKTSELTKLIFFAVNLSGVPKYSQTI